MCVCVSIFSFFMTCCLIKTKKKLILVCISLMKYYVYYLHFSDYFPYLCNMSTSNNNC